MPTMPRGYCRHPRCPYTSPCPVHREERPNSRERGYGGPRWKSARKTCLRNDPFCVCDMKDCDHLPGECGRVSTVADHDPVERADLIKQGESDPDQPRFLRGKCQQCHSRKTARTRPNGWRDR